MASNNNQNIQQSSSGGYQIQIEAGSVYSGTYQVNTGGGTINYYVSNTSSTEKLEEAASEIRDLLKQLEKASPANTMSQRMILAAQAIGKLEANPDFRKRVTAALTAGGLKSFESAIDHPAAAFVVSAIEGWKEA